MIGFGLALLVLFSLIGLVAGDEDPRRGVDPRDDLPLWIRFGLR